MKVGEFYVDLEDGEIIRITKIKKNEKGDIDMIYSKRITDYPNCDYSHDFDLETFNKYYKRPRGKKLSGIEEVEDALMAWRI